MRVRGLCWGEKIEGLGRKIEEVWDNCFPDQLKIKAIDRESARGHRFRSHVKSLDFRINVLGLGPKDLSSRPNSN